MPTSLTITLTADRRRRAQVLLAAFVVLALCVPIAGTLASDDIEITGEVVLEHADDFESGRKWEQTVLETKRGRFLLEGQRARGLEPGAIVRIKGKQRGETIVLGDGSSVNLVGTTSAGEADETVAAAAATKRVAVLLINFVEPPPPTPPPTPSPTIGPSPDPSASPTITPSPSPSPSPSPTPTPPKEPWTKNYVRGVYFNNEHSVANYYKELSNGQWTVTGDVFGYFTLVTSTNSCNYSGWGQAARQAATAAGINLSGYDNVVHAWGRKSACWWGGLAQVDGRYNWINGSMTPYVTMHELGHNFGAHHASTMTCTKNGSRVQISGNCSVDEYGDPFDVMGQNASGGDKQRHMQTWHRKQIGILGTADQQTITVNGRYTVAVAQVAGGKPRIMRVPRNSSEYYYLEYRRPYGVFDNYSSTAAVVNGVLIRIAPAASRVQSKLLDMNPATSGFSDAALAVGQTFTDNANGISIKTISLGSGSALMRIQVGPDTVPPTTPGGLEATTGSNNSVTLSWTSSSDDLEVSGYRVRRDGVVVANLAASKLSYTESALIDGVSYDYSVVAVDGGGNTSTPATATVQLPDTTPPSAPSNVGASQTGDRQVTISWAAATDNGIVTAYRIRRDGSLYASVGGSSTAFVDKGVTDGFGYSYEVRAEDAAGNLGPRITATPSPITLPDVTPPTAPGGFNLTSTSSTSAKVSWSAATDNVAVTGYRIWRDGALVATVGPGATSFSESSLAKGTYAYAVEAFDAAANVGPAMTSTVSVGLGADTTPPSVPGNLAGKALDRRYVQLSWSASTDDRPGTIRYRILRNDKRIATVTSLGYRDRAPDFGTYAYKVRAIDEVGNKSAFTPKISVKAVKFASPDTTAPSVPTNLVGKARDRRYVKLTWTASSDDRPETIRYRVFRNDVKIGVTTSTGYLDRAPSVGKHTYRLRAVDEAGNKSGFTPRITVKAVRAV